MENGGKIRALSIRFVGKIVLKTRKSNLVSGNSSIKIFENYFILKKI